jgi:hypothetical protein
MAGTEELKNDAVTMLVLWPRPLSAFAIALNVRACGARSLRRVPLISFSNPSSRPVGESANHGCESWMNLFFTWYLLKVNKTQD